MIKIEDIELYKQCIEKWGNYPQINIIVEELAELIVAIQKWKRNSNKETIQDIANEIADVELVLGQLQYIMSDNDKEFAAYLTYYRLYKRDRLKKRLDNKL